MCCGLPCGFVCGSKRQLQLLIPEARPASRLILFALADVDDLKDIADLEENVAQSGSILMFVSRGYFASVNCLREVVAAIDLKKPRIVVHEADTLKGGAGLEELRMELTDVSHRNAIFSDDKSVIRWFRLADFQVQSLLLIVQQMLTSSPTYRNKAEP
eukprot:7379608-Prymnesium_polylepis.2